MAMLFAARKGVFFHLRLCLNTRIVIPHRALHTSIKPLSVAVDLPKLTDCVVEPKTPTKAVAARQQAMVYMHLGKHRLTSLVVFTTFVGYYMGFGPLLSPTLPILLSGTFLQGLAANGCNQLLERRQDALMNRTQCRPLVIKSISVPHAILAVSTFAVTGAGLLWVINPLTCYLGLASLGIYVCVYTPLKRIHWINTWAGAVVGMLPPLMGSAAAGALDPTAWFVGGILYLWQMPHFLSLSYLCARDYSTANFQMLPCLDPKLASYYGLVHTAMLTGWCVAVPLFCNCSPYFVLEAALLNLWFLWRAVKYWKAPGIETARKMFRASILYLTILLLLLMFHRKAPSPPALPTWQPMD
eukprot:NODE_2816_length_1084_cov_27.549634_g2686_i0.p1 GENE.NODE_2816_length_1084_cov_27.549634_g2686_i0~~NODE_2816_length_1084_cov_27.549634_g2686_i0.p1  ORF type:complete len:356 (+),score=66.79 NODE_2816_length_1084_cov_27.549634_g2686_i0:3-1070(+)